MIAPRKKPDFALGRVVATPGALDAVETAGDNLSIFLSRHANGDWVQKQCSLCNKWKEMDEFYRRDCRCKSCSSKYAKKRWEIGHHRGRPLRDDHFVAE